MKRAFGFFLRLFIAFMAAKLVLAQLDADTPGYLTLLTALLVANAYLFDFLEQHGQGGWRARQTRGNTSPGPEAEDHSVGSSS
jgi:hypothetical protein|uniref:Uncharacterized protein n=1 Tax=Desulfobacca acetoxidans TaxID=60893 RepID=A0A7C3WI53_9BACT